MNINNDDNNGYLLKNTQKKKLLILLVFKSVITNMVPRDIEKQCGRSLKV